MTTAGSALIIASINNNVKEVKKLLESGVYAGVHNWAAIRVAVANGSVAAAELLFNKYNAPISAVDLSTFTKMCRNGHLKMIEVLRANGYNINANSNIGLVAACDGGHIRLVRHMVCSGADVNFNGGEPLSTAAREGHVQVAQYLLKINADVHASRDAALLKACKVGNLDMVVLLVENGADINISHGLPYKLALKGGFVKLLIYIDDKMDLE